MRKKSMAMLAMGIAFLVTGCGMHATTESQKPDNASINLIQTSNIGDNVIFGNYEQDGDLNNGKEPLEWKIVSKEDNKIFLMSTKIIDSQPYNVDYVDVTWEKSTLRQWLNSDFITNAFSEDEIMHLHEIELENPDFEMFGYQTEGGKATKDKAFLPTMQEIEGYKLLLDDMMAVNTPFAIEQGSYDDFGYGFYWLRSIGSDSQHASIVNKGGVISPVGTNVDFASFGIRPMICIENS